MVFEKVPAIFQMEDLNKSLVIMSVYYWHKRRKWWNGRSKSRAIVMISLFKGFVEL